MSAMRVTEGPKMCPRCRRARDADAFREKTRLAGGRDPWCMECVDVIETADDRIAYVRAYQHAYHALRKARRGGPAFARWRVRVASGQVTVCWMRRRHRVRITGPWRSKSDGDTLGFTLGTDPATAASQSRSGGSRFVFEAACDDAALCSRMRGLEREGRATRLSRRRSSAS